VKNKDYPEANMKIAEPTLFQIKEINNRLFKFGFDNIKVINAIAVDELMKYSKECKSADEFMAFVVVKIDELKKKGIIKDNARSIGKKK